jgi:hypothetical protein
MAASQKNDRVILMELREPIEDLVTDYFPNAGTYERVRLRQLAWQALDFLVKTSDIYSLKTDKNIQGLIKDVQEVGATQKFIDASFELAVMIFRKMQTEYPGLLKQYRGQ